MKIFILAAGQQLRFPDNYTPKQLLIINGETILERQLRQLRERNLTATVVTKNPLIQEKSPEWIAPKNNSTVVKTLNSTLDYWEDSAIFLLGDVFYSNELFNNIITNTQEIKFWVSGSEIFAAKLSKEKTKAALKEIINHRYAKLWHLYRALNNKNINKHEIFKNDMTGDIIVDHTFDIDSLQQYEDVSKYAALLKTTNPDL